MNQAWIDWTSQLAAYTNNSVRLYAVYFN